MFPAIAAAGKTVATSNKKHFQRRQRQHLGTMGSTSFKFSSYSSDASAARIRTGTEQQGPQWQGRGRRGRNHLTSTPAASENSGGGRSNKRRRDLRLQKEVSHLLATPVRATHAEANSQATWQGRGRRGRNTSQGSPPRREHEGPREMESCTGRSLSHGRTHVLTVPREA